MQGFGLPVALVVDPNTVEHAARDGVHLPAAQRGLQAGFDRGQVELPARKLAIVGQGPKLLGGLPAPLERFAQPGFRVVELHEQVVEPLIEAAGDDFLADGFDVAGSRRSGFDFARKPVALLAEDGGPRGLHGQFTQLLFLLNARFEQQGAAFVLQPAHGLDVLLIPAAELPSFAAKLPVAVYTVALPAEGCVELSQQGDRLRVGRADVRLGSQVANAAGDVLQLAAPLAQLLPPSLQLAEQLGVLLALGHHAADLLRAELRRQAQFGQRLAPAPAGRGQVAFRLGHPAPGLLDPLPRAVALAAHRHQFFEGRQFVLGRLQPGRDGPAALRKLRVERVALLLGLLDLGLDHHHLPLARFELAGVRPLQKHFAEPGRTGPEQAQHGHGPAERAGDRRRHEQPGHHEHDPQRKAAAERGNDPNRQELTLEMVAALLFEIGLVAGQFVEPVVDQQPASQLRDSGACLVNHPGQFVFVAAGEGRLHFPPQRFGLFLGLGKLLPGLLNSLAGCANRRRGRAQPLDRLVRQAQRGVGREVLREPDRFALAPQRALQAGDLRLKIGNVLLQRFDPRTLLDHRLDARRLAPQPAMDSQRLDFVLHVPPPRGQLVDALLVLRQARGDGVEPFDRALRQPGRRRQHGKLFLEFLALLPPLAERRGQLDHPGVLLDGRLLLFQARHLVVELLTFGGQSHVAAHSGGKLFDFAAQAGTLLEKLSDFARAAVAGKQPIARRLQLANHSDERNAVESRGEAVQQFGRLRIAQRAQLLHLAQADGEHVVEHGLVDVAQHEPQHGLALPSAVGGGHHDLLAKRSLGARLPMPLEHELSVRADQLGRSAGPAAAQRGQIPHLPGAEPIKQPADERQQRRLPRLVRAVQHAEAVGQPLDAQAGPYAVTVDRKPVDLHDWDSSPVRRSTPSRAASCSTRLRAGFSVSANPGPSASANSPSGR